MGKFPEYKRQVAASALNAPTPVVNNSSIGPGIAALGQGIASFGVGLGQMVAAREREDERAQREADALKVNVAKQKAVNLIDERTRAFTKLQGDNAISGSAQALTDFQDALKAIGEELSPSQRAMFEPAELASMGQFKGGVDDHTTKQAAQVRKNSDESILKLQTSNATGALLRGDMDSFEVAKAAALGQIDELSRQQGDTPVLKQAREFEFISGLHMASIESLLGAGNAGMAAQMLHEWDRTLDQNKVASSNLRQRVDNAVTGSNADTIMQEAWRKSGGDTDVAEAEIAKDSTLDPRVRELAIVKVRKYGEANFEALKAADSSTLATIGQTIGIAQGRYTLEELLNSEEFGALKTQEMRTKAINLTNAAIRSRRAEASGQASIDQEEWYRFLEAVEDNPDLADEGYDINSLHSNTSPKMRARMGAELANVRTRNMAKRSLPAGEFGKVIDANIPEGMDKDKATVLRKSYLDMLQNWRAENGGKNPPRKDVEEFFEKEKQKVEGTRKWWKPWSDDRTLQELRVLGKADPGVLPAPTRTIPPKAGDTVRVKFPSGAVRPVKREELDDAVKNFGGVIVQ